MSTATIDISSLDNPFGSQGYDTGLPAPVVDLTALNNLTMPGQLDGMPGGGVSMGSLYSADPSGINVVPSASGQVTPNKTGSWEQSMAAIATAAAGAFKAFEVGSPSVATPPPKTPSTSILGGLFGSKPVTGATGVAAPGTIAGFGYGTIAIIGIGIVALVVLIKVA